MQLSDLPPEVILLIGESIEKPADLVSFLLTSTGFHSLLKPVLTKLTCSNEASLLTALHWAIARGDSDMFRDLCARCPPRQFRIGFSVTQGPVVWSIPKFTATMSPARLMRWATIERVRLKIKTPNFKGTSLEWAVKARNRPLLELLLKPTNSTSNRTIKLARDSVLMDVVLDHRDVVGARLMLDVGGDLGTYDEDVRRGLFVVATQVCTTEMTGMLLEKGAEINETTAQFTGSAFFIAVSNDQKDMARFLMDNGADIFATPRSDGGDGGGEFQSMIHLAARKGNIEVVERMLQKGADVNCQAGLMGTALHLAAAHGDIAIVTLLLRHGADVKRKNPFSNKPVDIAGTKEVRRLLREQEGFGKMVVKLKLVFRSVFKSKIHKKI